jgi:hypothetical protein
MKFIFSFLAIVMLTESCNSNKEAVTNTASLEESTNVEDRLAMQDQDVTISYRASTRGFFEVIEIKGDSVSFTKDYNLKNIDKAELSQEEKADIINLLSKIDINALTELEPPSKTHQYDAAPAAFLKITKGDTEFMTPSFDHGKPPKAISNIVEKILSLKTLFEKP